MQTLRKKTSPCKYKNEPSRFLGEGVSFKAKLIGILEVSEARGDRMCQEALADLKMAIRAAGEHKQRITINIAIDGLRLRDEKTGDSLYHHPVHKISFIAQDMSDSRAFGYIFGSPDTGHRFFGIKTDKAASQVVIAMRDLFQVVFELKKKEIELAKQHIEQKSRFGTNTTSSLFSDSAISSTKSYHNGDSQHSSSKLTSVSESSTSKIQSSNEGAAARPSTTSDSAIADLVDLELELSSIQQGIHQMERITPSDPFGPNKDDLFGSDPFGDSFTSFPQKPFLPPPPSARDRPRNTSTSDTSSSLFSPKTPKTGGSVDTIAQDLFKNSHDDQNSSGWFTPTGGTDSLFEDAISSVTPVSTSDAVSMSKEVESAPAKESNVSILSQFDVFTELDPLGTGRSKPYIDKKLFFQELKNPPKKVLKDLVTETQPTEATLFTANFETNTHTTTTFTNSATSSLFQTDPFADGDPFDKADPFAEDDFVKTQDPFDTDFVGDFKGFNKKELKPMNKSEPSADQSDKFKLTDKIQPLFTSPLSKSPNRSSIFEKQMSLSSTSVSPRTTTSLSKQNTFDVKFDDIKSFNKLGQLHENPSLDISSESESAPEPPPRPANNITPIKPPPLPPKKQAGDLAIKPPPRPPHSEESHYDYMDTYETGFSNLESFDNLEKTPPLPVPARKSRFDSSDFNLAPQRPKKQFQSQSTDDDYLTPIASLQKKDNNLKNVSKDSGPILLPPPMKKDSSKRNERLTNQNQVTVASYLESKPKVTSTTASDKLNLTADTLDITLSQLTLSGLNELANKLNIPASQLSNMTLVQLTNFLSNYVRNARTNENTSSDATFPTFKADFSANFNDSSNCAAKSEPYDRYAVFRELLQQEEIKKVNETKGHEQEERAKIQEPDTCISETLTQKSEEKKDNFKSAFQESNTTDKYAALREIIIEDTIMNDKKDNLETVEENNDDINDDTQKEEEKQQNDLNQESTKIKDDTESNDKSNIIEYESSLELKKEKIKSATPTKSPTLVKSPIPTAVTDIIQNSNHLTSGSVSDVVSGSSPEIDNVANTSEVVLKKNVENTTRESWAIFDTPNHHRRGSIKEKQVQSEEGVSPWSSDSKEFGNGSPSEWQQRRDSGSEGDWVRRRRERDGTWWDSQGEMEGHYEKSSRAAYSRERRSTDSYDDEWYEPDRPRRRIRQPASTHTWSKSGSGTISGGAGGQSSSSRDVSPWEEEEPRTSRREREDRACWPGRRARGPSWDRNRRRRDSWEEDDDYDYEDGYTNTFHWPERHGSRESDRGSRESDRHSSHSGPREPHDHWDSDQWSDERRHGRRRGHSQDERWCRPDWDMDSDMVCGSKEKMRYSNSRWPNQEGKWRGERERERKRDSDRYYKRDHSQESPWEDDYSNDPDEPRSSCYLTARRNWKRPSSASEMDRKSGEIKSRQSYYIGAGGSDGENRKYRANRRSRSRDSQFSEISHQRHKADTSLTLGRYSHRNRDKIYNQKFDNDFPPQENIKSKLDVKLEVNKKSTTLGRKKGKEMPSPKTENDNNILNKGRKQHLMFENDFVNSEADSPVSSKAKFNFDNEFNNPDTEPSSRYSKSSNEHFHSKRIQRPNKQSIGFENDFSKENLKSNRSQERESSIKSVSPSLQMNIKQKSLFEDDFSPSDKNSHAGEDNGITVIAEESVSETRVSFTENNLDRATSHEGRRHTKNILSKSRMASNIRGEAHLKKSESVNIFARENDPFDDDFFSGKDSVEIQQVETSKVSPNNVTELKWTEDFDSFDIPEENK